MREFAVVITAALPPGNRLETVLRRCMREALRMLLFTAAFVPAIMYFKLVSRAALITQVRVVLYMATIWFLIDMFVRLRPILADALIRHAPFAIHFLRELRGQADFKMVASWLIIAVPLYLSLKAPGTNQPTYYGDGDWTHWIGRVFDIGALWIVAFRGFGPIAAAFRNAKRARTNGVATDGDDKR